MKAPFQAFTRVWCTIWFEPLSTAPLELTRIGISAALFIHYSLATPHLSEFWGNAGWMPPELLAAEDDSPLKQSLLFYLTSPWQLQAFHYIFLASCAALLIGWKTSWVKWIVLIGQISYDHRNPMFLYGVDKILASLLLILCLAPIGRHLSLDRVLAIRSVNSSDPNKTLPNFKSEWAGACTRLMQVQMAVLFFFSALSKLNMDDWWNGDAVWFVFTTDEHYSPAILQFLANHYWLVNLATYGTIFIEIAYVFLIWQRATRPYLLAGALFLHAQFALVMGLFYFSFVMMMGHLSFVRPEWLSQLALLCKRRLGAIRLFYDGESALSVQTARWIRAFDGLNQVQANNMRVEQSSQNRIDTLHGSISVISSSGQQFTGFDAYRFAILRVPGLWLFIPFFCVPVVSRLFWKAVHPTIATIQGRASPNSDVCRTTNELARQGSDETTHLRTS